MKRVARLHTCVAMATVSPPPSATWSLWATSPARYFVPHLSPPHPVVLRVNPASSRKSAPATHAPLGPPRAPARTFACLSLQPPTWPGACPHCPPSPRPRVFSPSHPALLFAASTVPTRGQAPPPSRPPPLAPTAARLLIGWPAGLTPAPPKTGV